MLKAKQMEMHCNPLHKQAPQQLAAPCTDPASCLTHREGVEASVTMVAARLERAMLHGGGPLTKGPGGVQ
jgi:hypothetical protein